MEVLKLSLEQYEVSRKHKSSQYKIFKPAPLLQKEQHKFTYCISRPT